jgi:hypothetical protein
MVLNGRTYVGKTVSHGLNLRQYSDTERSP